MKERMRKLTLLVFYQEKEMIISGLQDLGVLHLESAVDMESEELVVLQKEREEWVKALAILKDQAKEHRKGNVSHYDLITLRDLVLENDTKAGQIHHRLNDLRKEEAQLAAWGGFEWDKIRELQEHNVFFRFYTTGKKEFKKFDFSKIDNLAVEVVSRDNGIIRFVAISKGEGEALPFEQINLPEKSLREINAEKNKLHEELKKLSSQLDNTTFAIPEFEKALMICDDKLSKRQALEGLEEKAWGKIEILRGWFPEKAKPAITRFLKENNLSYEIKKPGKGDKVPVILKNKKYPRIFETITKIFQLPDYKEFDLTPFIAVFYPIFFAYCLGDAGYGLVLVVLSAVAAFTFLREMKGVALLGMILGIVTMVMGIVKSGTLFGIPIAQHTQSGFFDFLSNYIVVTDNQDYIFNAFNVALMIGVVQIIVAVIISITGKIRNYGFTESLAGFGKLFIIISTIVLFLGSVQHMELFLPYLTAAKVFLILGVVMVLFFHDTTLSVPKRIGSGILPLYFIFTGLLGDVLSYIRLFALGVASSILGLVVNQIGSQMMEGAGVVGIILTILFLVFGHTINFALACLGAFVHPLRLTFVEFYNNAEFKGGGVEYKPFKKQIT